MAHHHHGKHVSRKLVIAAIATVCFVIVEMTIGFIGNSLALVGDALHNLTDSLALLLAWMAVRLEKRPATSEKSYGYQRAGILAAFLNAATLVGFTVYIFIEAFDRFRNPHVVNVGAMLITAIGAIVLNTAITVSLRHEGRDDVNIRAAVMHMLGDAVSSAGIVAAALVIRSTGNPIWDPAISILIGVLILWSSWGILRETVNLLLEGTPTGIDPDAVSGDLSKMSGVFGVHHLHIWALGPSRPALSCHVMVGDVPVNATGKLLEEMTAMLAAKYGIAHITIQFEFANCSEDDLYCVPYTESEASVQLK
ncbi:MAG TPA: cation diffusion facilitator family transporter [Thermoanaerobaculia bacterium]|nr:cation diffusion facilitator family transporter [Thermoanaerobaculia bacterium]